MKRQANGCGTMAKLSGNRAKPYAAYTSIKNVGGKRKREVIGYFESEAECRMALTDWNRSQGSKLNFTLEMLYLDWRVKGFAKISRSTTDGYKSAWNHMEPLHKMKVKNIRTGHFQSVVDKMTEKGLSYSTIHNVKVLAGLLEKYAMQYDIISKNYAEFVELPENTTEEREAFTEEQVKKLEDAAENDFMYSRLILILVYSGWRINEFLNLTVNDYDPKLKAFTGGLKTDYGRNRVVPVHSTIQPYIDELLQSESDKLVTRKVEKGRSPNKYIETIPMTLKYFRNNCFYPTLEELGIKQTSGENFTPHATRHTFATLANKYEVPELVLKKILGHSPGKSVTERVYIHIDFQQLRDGIEKIRPKEHEPFEI